MRNTALFAVAILAVVPAPYASAADYPIKPIRMIAPFPLGGGTDQLARVIAGPMYEALGEQIVVDNRPGAGGAIAAELAALAEPDGYTFILVSSSYTATSAYRKSCGDSLNAMWTNGVV